MREKLTDLPFWECRWNNLKLPITVDPQKQSVQTMNKLFKIYLDHGTKKFLEIGCGSSKWLIYFHKNFGYDVHGIDYSEEACRASKTNLALMKVSGKVVRGDLFNSPFHDGTFDVIFNGGLIEHFINPIVLLRRMTKLLKPGGYIITSIPNIESIYWIIQKVIDKQLYEQHFKIPIDELNKLYRRAGLAIDVIRYIGSFDLFSIDWSRPRSGSEIWRRHGMLLVGKTNAGINRCLRKLSIDFRSRLFSPFIIGIGHKS